MGQSFESGPVSTLKLAENIFERFLLTANQQHDRITVFVLS